MKFELADYESAVLDVSCYMNFHIYQSVLEKNTVPTLFSVIKLTNTKLLAYLVQRCTMGGAHF